MSTRPRIALIGLGMAVTPHALALQDLAERVEVAWAFSPSAARREAFGQRYGFPLCDRIETILDDDSVSAVLVLTPPNTHLEIVGRCAAAGKHVLLEKPLEISTARAAAAGGCLPCGRRDARHRAAAPLPCSGRWRWLNTSPPANSARSSVAPRRSGCGGRSPTTTSRAAARLRATAAAC